MSNKTKALLCTLASSFFLAGVTLFVNLAGDLPTPQKVFFRNLVPAVCAFAGIIKSGQPLKLEKRSAGYVITRAVAGTMSMICNFYAIDRIAMSDASMLNKISPFFAVIFSYLLLKEKVKPAQFFTLIGAFVGALFVIRPTGANMQLVPSIVAGLGGVFAGLAFASLRGATAAGASHNIIVFMAALVGCLAMLPPMLLSYVPMTARQSLALLACGLCGTVGHFIMTSAYHYAPAREISIFEYSQVIFAGIFGFVFFGQLPVAISLIGYALMMGMGAISFIIGHPRFQEAEARKKADAAADTGNNHPAK